jgi:hypothetical protein
VQGTAAAHSRAGAASTASADELRHHAPSSSSTISDRQVVCPAHSTDNDSSVASSDSPQRFSGGETDEGWSWSPRWQRRNNGCSRQCISMVVHRAASSYSLQASGDSTAARRSERSKTNVDRWRPPSQRDASRRPADPSLHRGRSVTLGAINAPITTTESMTSLRP